jgi:hypothetical protein
MNGSFVELRYIIASIMENTTTFTLHKPNRNLPINYFLAGFPYHFPAFFDVVGAG